MVQSTKGIRELIYNRENVSTPNRYPFTIPALRHFKSLKFHPRVTYLSGENGMGKSTLIEAIAVAYGFNPEGGSRNFNFATRASHSELHNYFTLARGPKHRDGFFLRSESFFNLATNIEDLDKERMGAKLINSYGGVSLHEQSHGESFWALFMNRFTGDGLYILDEPEAALSPTRQMALLTRMHELIGAGAQFIIATHSPIILAYPHATIYELTANGINKTSFTETENFKIFHGFMTGHKAMIKILLDEE